MNGAKVKEKYNYHNNNNNNKSYMTEITTIPIKKETRDKLKTFGLKGETYNEIINRLMEQIEYEEFMERQYRRLGEKEKFISLDDI